MEDLNKDRCDHCRDRCQGPFDQFEAALTQRVDVL